MTREEQIIEAGAYHSSGSRPPKTCGHNMHGLAYITRNLAFEAGAKWADENPKYRMVKLDKVIKWLQENTVKNFDNKNLTMLFGSTIEMIDDFRKAMEE